MATRNTEKEANELKGKISNDFPGLNIVIDHEEGESAVFPGAIKAQGLTVSRWDGETPYVRWEKWHIRELVTCRKCGHSWPTDAIGEDNAFCLDCSETLHDPRTNAEVREDTANEMARSLRQEWWCE